jgi:cell wall assembly regulator SMI1
MINFRYTESPIVAADLDEVERRFGFRFPPEFRDLYLRFNGGRPEKDRFVDDKGTCIVHEFMPIKNGKPGLTFEHDFQQTKVAQSLLPEHLVPFAVDPGGNFYCFSTRDDEVGAIFIFRTDYFDNPKRATEYLTSSLSAFLGALTTRGTS